MWYNVADNNHHLAARAADWGGLRWPTKHNTSGRTQQCSLDVWCYRTIFSPQSRLFLGARYSDMPGACKCDICVHRGFPVVHKERNIDKDLQVGVRFNSWNMRLRSSPPLEPIVHKERAIVPEEFSDFPWEYVAGVPAIFYTASARLSRVSPCFAPWWGFRLNLLNFLPLYAAVVAILLCLLLTWYFSPAKPQPCQLPVVGRMPYTCT